MKLSIVVLTLMAVVLALFITIALLIIIAIILYNKMVSNRNRMQEAWSSIDVFLKKRWDQIPNLVEIVKGYATHEKTLLENVTRARTEAMQSKMPHDRVDSEAKLEKAFVNLLAVVENYPELKANANFQELQRHLSSLEEEIERSRRYYNGTVRENNTYIEQFPVFIFASIFNFTRGEYFTIEPSERIIPQVSFS